MEITLKLKELNKMNNNLKKGNPEEIFEWFSRIPKDEEFANLLDDIVKKELSRNAEDSFRLQSWHG